MAALPSNVVIQWIEFGCMAPVQYNKLPACCLQYEQVHTAQSLVKVLVDME